MNKAESSYTSLKLRQMGFLETGDPAEADYVILQTCSVRITAENRIWGRLGYYSALKKSRNLKIIVVGCMAERLGAEIVKRQPAVDLVLGNVEKMKLYDYLGGEESGSPAPVSADAPGGYKFPKHYGYTGAFQAFVPIMHGCNNFCSYCIVPYVRGREISRSVEKILYELKTLEDSGVKEVTLLGQNVNSYSGRYKSKSLDFPALLKVLLQQNPRIPWFRFLTSHPKDFSASLIETIAEHRRICREIHVPVQHGSNTILAAMNRNYTREDYLLLIEKLRQAVPNVSITTDILIGFPGETEEDFNDTLALLRRVRFDDAYTYKYNKREGTPAVNLTGHLPEDLKGARLKEIIAIQRDISKNTRKKRIGDTVDVFIKQVSKKEPNELLGVTEFGASVVVKGTPGEIGNIISMRLAGLEGSTYKGEKI